MAETLNQNQDWLSTESQSPTEGTMMTLFETTEELTVRAKAFIIEALTAATSPLDAMQIKAKVETRNPQEKHNWHLYQDYLNELKRKGIVNRAGLGKHSLIDTFEINTNKERN